MSIIWTVMGALNRSPMARRSATSVVAALLLLGLCNVAGAAESATGGQPADSTAHAFMEELEELQAQEELQEYIRHQRQIKFKSSYSELPEVLRQAEERNRAGKSLSKSVLVIADDAASHESAALKDLPPSSEVYFQPEVDKTIDDAGLKHFGKSSSSPLKDPFRFRTKSTSAAETNKSGKFVKKKMVKKKLIKPDTPNPKRVVQKPIIFLTSSSENVENTLTGKSLDQKHSFQSSRISGAAEFTNKIQNGGPNPNESFKNPFYVETPASEISSYSFVPDSSTNSESNKSRAKPQHQSTVPTPTKLSFNTQKQSHGHKTQENKINRHSQQHFANENSKSITEKRKRLKNIMNRRNEAKQATVKRTESHFLNNWDHFLPKQSEMDDKIELADFPKSINFQRKHQLTNKSPRIGKSFSSQRTSPTAQKLVHREPEFSNLIDIPVTKFHCGNYRGGEYFADTDTKCQVFHVCYGGRQASFVCPAGTAFSQQLLVCDWRNKVTCGGVKLQPLQRAHANRHAQDNLL